MIIQFLAIVAGVAAHQFRPMVEGLNTDSQTVKNLANYSIGFIAVGVVYECANGSLPCLMRRGTKQARRFG